MRRVEQRTTGWPYGECVRASYAMLLDLPIEEVPRFDPAALSGERQRDAECRWLASLDLGLIDYRAPHGGALPDEVLGEMPPVYHLIQGLSPRGVGHCCVGFAGQVAIDPHPSQAGLVYISSCAFVVPLEALAPLEARP